MLYASHSWARKREFSTKGPKRGSGKLIVGMAILLVVAFKLDSLEPRWARNKKKRKKETKKRGEKNVRETRDAHRKENEGWLWKTRERTVWLLFPFAVVHLCTNVCVPRSPFALDAHVASCFDDIKGISPNISCTEEPRTTYSSPSFHPFPPNASPSLPLFPPFHPLTPSISSPPVSAFHRRNQCGEYVYKRVCVYIYIYVHTQGHPW